MVILCYFLLFLLQTLSLGAAKAAIDTDLTANRGIKGIISADKLAGSGIKGVVEIPIYQNNQNPKRTSNRLTKRSRTYLEPLANNLFYYSASITVGTPPQIQEIQIDTGSSDLVFYASNVTDAPTTFHSDISSSFEYEGDDFLITYVSGNATTGYWGKDTVSIAGATISDLQFAIAYQYNDSPAVLGVGFEENESVHDSPHYPNLPRQLVDQGYISKNIYSIYLNSANATAGSILFGGIDTQKYWGVLQPVPIIDRKNMMVTVSAVSVLGNFLSPLTPSFNATLDSGTSFSYLPEENLTPLAEGLGAVWNDTLQAYFFNEVPNKKVIYRLGLIPVVIVGSELALSCDSLELTGCPSPYILSIFPSWLTQNQSLLGDSFLRSVYAAFDLENDLVYIGQARHTDQSTIVPFSGVMPKGVHISF